MRHGHRSRTIPLATSLLCSALAAATVLHTLTTAFSESVAVAQTRVAIFHPADPAPVADSPLTVTGATAAETAMTDWAIDRFELAGLTLPSVTLDFRDDDECGGAAGLYLHSTATLTVCNRGDHHNPPRHTLLHELAHAWSLHTMDDGDIAAFLADQGLSHWTGGDPGYWGQGAERVAEYVAWGLQDSDDEDRSIWTYGKDCTDLDAAFRLITEAKPLNASPGWCTTS